MQKGVMFYCALILTLLFSALSVASSSVDTCSKCDVFVGVSTNAVPAEKSLQDKFLWDTFVTRPEIRKFDRLTVQNFSQNSDQFTAQLIHKAEKEALEHAALEKILDKIKREKKRGAMLPVGAYSTYCDGRPIWVVVVKWSISDKPVYSDFDNDGVQEVGWTRMATCVFAYDIETLKLAGFISEM
jgi:hypothetical protein